MTSLRAIHLVFIGASITLMVLVALWGVAMYASDGARPGIWPSPPDRRRARRVWRSTWRRSCARRGAWAWSRTA